MSRRSCDRPPSLQVLSGVPVVVTMSFPSEAFDLAEESDALSTLFSYINGEEVDLTTSLDFVRRTYSSLESSSAEEWLMIAAMAKILAKDIPEPDFAPMSGPADQHVFVSCANAWGRWAGGYPDLATKALKAGASNDLHAGRGRALHLMALASFRGAVEALISDDLVEAQRLFRRSIEMGSQMGTETNPVIQWVFVASFFKHG